MYSLKILKKITIYFTLIFRLGYLALHLVSWKKCNCSTRFIPFQTLKESEERKCLIAFYKSSSNSEVISVSRILKTHPWKYLFYTPKEYSKEIFISDQFFKSDIKLILSGEDTLYRASPLFHYALKNIPDSFIVFYKNSDTATYRLTDMFQENYDNISTVPFSEKWDSGPLHNDN